MSANGAPGFEPKRKLGQTTRRLMLFQNVDASHACQRVGYLSASLFSREYARFFGSAPTKDVGRLPEDGFAPAPVETLRPTNGRLAAS